MDSTERPSENTAMLTQSERRKSISDVLAKVGKTFGSHVLKVAGRIFEPMDFIEQLQPETGVDEVPVSHSKGASIVSSEPQADGTRSPAQHQENPALLGVGCQSYKSRNGSKLSLGSEFEAIHSSDLKSVDGGYEIASEIVGEPTGPYLNIDLQSKEDKRAVDTAAPQNVPCEQPSANSAKACSFMANAWDGIQDLGAIVMGNRVRTGCTTDAFWPEVDSSS